VEVAELVIEEQGREEMPVVAAGLAVLAGIAASDAICAVRLHEIHRGDDPPVDDGVVADVPDRVSITTDVDVIRTLSATLGGHGTGRVRRPAPLRGRRVAR
jgi:hypothetical protein